MKMLKKSMLKEKQQSEYVNFEIQTMKNMNHPHLLEIVDILPLDFEVMLVVPFSLGGDL